MQEGMSYAAGAELPIVIVNISRGGPGLGNIAPEQGDYNQAVKKNKDKLLLLVKRGSGSIFIVLQTNTDG